MRNETTDAEGTTIEPGETVYNEDGEMVGVVHEPTKEGFSVDTVSDAEVVETDAETGEDLPGHGFGEGYIMWRCGECGEMGELEDGLPEECPNCGAPKEEITKARED